MTGCLDDTYSIASCFCKYRQAVNSLPNGLYGALVLLNHPYLARHKHSTSLHIMHHSSCQHACVLMNTVQSTMQFQFAMQHLVPLCHMCHHLSSFSSLHDLQRNLHITQASVADAYPLPVALCTTTYAHSASNSVHSTASRCCNLLRHSCNSSPSNGTFTQPPAVISNNTCKPTVHQLPSVLCNTLHHNNHALHITGPARPLTLSIQQHNTQH